MVEAEEFELGFSCDFETGFTFWIEPAWPWLRVLPWPYDSSGSPEMTDSPDSSPPAAS